ncbi:MAG TPA: CoA transferase [Chloroflexota bacterium]|nr:CoA transferase [Chloroflexota bacterium]
MRSHEPGARSQGGSESPTSLGGGEEAAGSRLPTPGSQACGGLRVIEFGGFAAGPVVGKHMANYGAEVIRIESRRALDGFRTHYPPYKDNVPGTERAGIFSFFNDGKRSVTINLKTPRGCELARELVAKSDVVVENFTPGTIARLGLGYDVLSQANPGLVMLSTCNQGQTGPHANHPGFGSHLTSLAGFTHLLGFPGETPSLLYGPYIDYVAVGFGTIAVLAALARRKRTGKGAYIDLSQYETGAQFMAPALLDYFVNGRVPTRAGNRHPSAVPHGVFPCRGEEKWVALSVADDAEWQRFVEAIGEPAWTAEPVFATIEDRKANEDRLEGLVGEWTRQRDREGVVKQLRAGGLCAYPVNSMADLFSDPQLLHRQTWRPVEHPVQGNVHAAAPPFTLKSTPPQLERPAPCLGADNSYVLGEILGLTDANIDELAREGVLD